jgi:formate/nitrite transporter FocA (FNT family)
MDPKLWGGVQTLVTGGVFALGLVLVVVAGSELLTGNMAMIPLAVLGRRATIGRLSYNFFWVLIGNLLGSLFVASSWPRRPGW